MPNYYGMLEIGTKAILVTAFCLNILLIHLIKTYSRSALGTFKNLLLIFASYDIFLIILHFVFDPKVVVLPGIFAVVVIPYFGSKLLSILECISFMISYVILMLHLLYRYWLIQKHVYIQLFSSFKFALVLSAAVLISYGIVACLCQHILSPDDSVATCLVKAEFRRKFGRSIEDGWVIADYWPNGKVDYLAITAPIAIDSMGLAIVIGVVTLASLTYRFISAAYSLSPSAKSAQIRLLTTVCVQAFIPMLCVIVPYFIDCTLPAFGLTFPLIADATGLFMSLFPLLDSLAVILLMKPYRDGLWSMMTVRKLEPTRTISISLNAAI